MWPLLLRLASLPGCPVPTAIRVLRRHLQFDPAHVEHFIAFLVSAGRWREAADHLAAAVNDDCFVSAKGRTKRQLLLDLCHLLAQHPEEVAGLPVDAILRGSVRRFPDEAGALWTCLAGHYARVGLHGKARDVFEEGVATATTVKDFRLVFEAYLHFENAMIDVELGEHGDAEENTLGQGCWLADRDDGDMALARLERLLERRPELLNRVQLRQNPHDVQAWHARAKLFDEDPARKVATYVEAVKTVDPAKATGKPPPHTLWLAFAKMYEDRGLLDSAREVLRRATQASFKAADHLAAVWCEWAEMELRQHNANRAIELIRQATSEPSLEVRRQVAAGVGETVVQTKLHRSLKLWCFYADLMETHGSPESTCAVYDRMHELGIITPLLVLRHASLLQEHKRFEDAFRVYERGVRTFKYPHGEAIWAAYLTKFVERHGASKPQRVRDLFDDAVRHAPAEKKAAVYARFEEDFGLAKRVLKVYEEAAAATSSPSTRRTSHGPPRCSACSRRGRYTTRPSSTAAASRTRTPGCSASSSPTSRLASAKPTVHGRCTSTPPASPTRRLTPISGRGGTTSRCVTATSARSGRCSASREPWRPPTPEPAPWRSWPSRSSPTTPWNRWTWRWRRRRGLCLRVPLSKPIMPAASTSNAREGV